MNKRKILESAQKHLQRGALDKALEDYQTLVKADPRDANVRLKVGDLHLKLGRTQDAIDAYLRVAQQFTNEGFDAKAVALYKQITKLDEKRFEVNAQLGELYQRMGLTSEAMRAIQLAADGAHRAGDKGQALTLLRRMAALDPTNTASRLKVADLLRAEGKPEDALAEYDEVVRELERQKNTEEQIKVLERALELAPSRVESLRALARAALEADNPAKAEKAARAALAVAPEDLDGLELLGKSLERAGRADEAADAFRGLAEKYRARGDEDRARELMQRYGAGEALEVGDSDPPVLEADASDLEIDPELDSLGLVEADELELGGESGGTLEPEAAVEDSFEPSAEPAETSGAGAELDPDADVEQLLAEASVFSRYGKHERAIETLRAALRIEPGSAPALEKLGESLAAIGNRAHAASALSRAGAAYAEAGDAAAVERVRGLLAPLDAKAAAALVPPPPSDRSAIEPEVIESDELDIEIDAGLDDDTMTPAPSASASDASQDDFSGIDIDVSSDLAVSQPPQPHGREASEVAAPADDEAEFTFDPADDSEPLEAERPSAPASEPVAAPQGSAGSPEADLEEAEFYREQGLLDEARALYERVLAAAPSHPEARARLAELAAGASGAESDAALENATSELDLAIDERAAESPEEASDDATSPELTPEPAPREKAAAAESSPAAAAPQAAPPAPALPAIAHEEAPPALLGGADFDLAAELSGAFGEGADARSASGSAGGDGFDEVFAAFKAGVKREVGDGDFEAHFDLGIAYKEMGLLDDAIGEFRVAMGDPARKLACLHLMGVCALDVGRAGDAVAHLSEALAAGSLPREQEAALRVDLGRAHQAGGDRVRARAELEAARAADPSFAGIDERIAQLDADSETPAPAAEEPFESFDDLIENPPREAAPAAPTPAAPEYESFDELLSEDSIDDPASSSASSSALAAEDEAAIELQDEVREEPPYEAPAAEAPALVEAPPRAAAPEPVRAPDPPPSPAAPAARRKKKISFV